MIACSSKLSSPSSPPISSSLSLLSLIIWSSRTGEEGWGGEERRGRGETWGGDSDADESSSEYKNLFLFTNFS